MHNSKLLFLLNAVNNLKLVSSTLLLPAQCILSKRYPSWQLQMYDPNVFAQIISHGRPILHSS